MPLKKITKSEAVANPLAEYTLPDADVATAHPAFSALTPKVLRSRVLSGHLIKDRDFITVGFGPRAPRYWHADQLLKTLSGSK